MSVLTNVWDWLKKEGSQVKNIWNPIAISITEELKTLWASGVPNFLATIADKLLDSGTLIEDVVAKVGAYLPAFLVAELGIQDLPADPTPADYKKFENDAIAAFGNLTDKDKFYTTLQAQIAGVIQPLVQPGAKLTFGVLASDGEEIYQDYLADIAALQIEEANPGQAVADARAAGKTE